MPPMSWPSLDDDWDQRFGIFFSCHRPRVPPPRSPSLSPPPNAGCRHPNNNVIVASPCLPVQADGRCFLRSTPTFFRPRVGSSRAPRTRALLDNCANLCLANKGFILRCIPSVDIHEDFTTGVDGIGSARTVGYVHAPIYVDCMSRIGGKIGKVELNLEIHLIEGLPGDLIVGMDAICAYGIDTIISRSLATLSVRGRDLAFPMEFRRSNGMRDPESPDGFAVICNADVVVPPLHEASISIVTGLGSLRRGDAWLHPVHVKNDNRLWSPLEGGWVADGLIRPGQPHVLFANMSTRHPRLQQGQVIGRLTLCDTHDCFGTSTITHSPATAILAASLMDPHNRDPSNVVPTPGSAFDISPDCRSLPIAQVLEAHRPAFSFDGRPGIVNSVRIPIPTDDTLLFADSTRQVGPHKRRIIDDSIDQLLAWDIIEPSNSRVGYPVVLVKQHDKWRFCVDYRNLNLATTGQVYPMTRTDSIFDALHGKSVFSILDAAHGYHQLPIAGDDRWKTAFLTHRGLYQYKRMSFGLKNAPLQFQSFMDSVLGSLRWTSALVYIDDILVFSDDLDSHTSHLATLLDSAIAVGLKFNPSKCHFAYPSLKVLGHRVSTDGLSVLEDRAAAIRELATPRTLKELWHVLGIFGYYRQFIPRYAMVAAPLTRLTKGTRFQKLPDGTWQPRESPTRGASPLVDWRPAHDAAFQSLKDALSSPPTLAFPNFSLPFIVYVDSSHDGMAACLHQLFLPSSDLPLSTINFACAHPSFSFDFAEDELNRLRCDLQTDRVFSQTYKLLSSGTQTPSDRFEMANGILYWRLRDGRLATCLPESMVRSVLTAAHDSFGHWGFDKTWSFVKARFYRRGLSDVVQEYVRRCPDCQRVKASRQHKLGRMSPHEIPDAAFHTVSMDIILGLPLCGSFDACMVIVDIFSKGVILRPTVSHANARECGNLFFDALVCRGFLPVRLITDRDPRFVSQFWDELMRRLHIECKVISAYHQQADPAERYIQTIQTLLRLYVDGDNWLHCLPFIELVRNNTKNSSTGFSPKQLLFIDPPNLIPVLGDAPAEVSDPDDRLGTASAKVEQARDNLDKASLLQKRYYDSRHSPSSLKAGDRVFVLLDGHPIRSLIRGMHKLQDNKWGPFSIVEMVGTQAARLDLPPSSRVHPVISSCISNPSSKTLSDVAASLPPPP